MHTNYSPNPHLTVPQCPLENKRGRLGKTAVLLKSGSAVIQGWSPVKRRETAVTSHLCHHALLYASGPGHLLPDTLLCTGHQGEQGRKESKDGRPSPSYFRASQPCSQGLVQGTIWASTRCSVPQQGSVGTWGGTSSHRLRPPLISAYFTHLAPPLKCQRSSPDIRGT